MREPAGSHPADPLIVIGEVARPHGLRGVVRVVAVTDFPDHLLTLEHAVLVCGRTATRVRVEHAQPDGRWVLMKFVGIDTLDAAERLRGATIEIPMGQAAPLPPGQFYLFEVIGLEVRTPEGQVIGRVVDVLRTGANDVYVVRPGEGPELLLPAVSSCIEKIDPAAGCLVARPPEWLP